MINEFAMGKWHLQDFVFASVFFALWQGEKLLLVGRKITPSIDSIANYHYFLFYITSDGQNGQDLDSRFAIEIAAQFKYLQMRSESIIKWYYYPALCWQLNELGRISGRELHCVRAALQITNGAQLAFVSALSCSPPELSFWSQLRNWWPEEFGGRKLGNCWYLAHTQLVLLTNWELIENSSLSMQMDLRARRLPGIFHAKHLYWGARCELWTLGAIEKGEQCLKGVYLQRSKSNRATINNNASVIDKRST